MKAGFIGCGNMGGTLALVAAKSGAQVLTADHHPEKLEALRPSGCLPSTAEEIAGECDFIFLGVKPQVLRPAAARIAPILAGRKDCFVVVSMAAGVTLASLSEMLGGPALIRIMPNTPAAVGEGVLLYCTGGDVTEAEEDSFRKLMAGAGLCVRLEEGKIDMGSAVAGCGPAFVCLLMEAMIDAGVRCGLPRDKAKLFTLQTFAGTAKLALETGKDPAELRAAVCSPGGSTIEGVAALEKDGARYAMLEAVAAAYKRTRELG